MGRVTTRNIHSRKYLGTVALPLAEGAALIPQAAAAQTAAMMDRLALLAQNFIFGAVLMMLVKSQAVFLVS